MTRLVYVCTTCDRNARVQDGDSAGAALAHELRAGCGAALIVRAVACLSGCLRPCNVAFRGADRFTFRFSRVVADDVPAIVEFGGEYWHSAEGDVPVDRIGLALRAKLTVRTPPRGRW